MVIRVPPEKRMGRGGVVRRLTHKVTMDEMLKGKHFEFIQEIHMPKGQFFITPMGMRARHGYMLRNVDTGQIIIVGYKILKIMLGEYKNLSGWTPRANGRPKGSKSKKKLKDELDDYLANVEMPEKLFIDEDEED